MWRFRVDCPWRDVLAAYGNWSTIYDRFRTWACQGVFENLMNAIIEEVAALGDVELDLVSVDSSVCRAYHHAAGMVGRPERLEEPARAVAEEKEASPKGQTGPVDQRPGDEPDPELERRRRVRRHRKARLKAADPGRSRGGLTSKIHLSADRRRPPSAVDRAHPRAGRRQPPLHPRPGQDLGARAGRPPPPHPAGGGRRRQGLLPKIEMSGASRSGRPDDGVWLKAYCCCGSGGMAAPLSGTPRLLIEI